MKRFLLTLALTGLSAAAILVAGCEAESADQAEVQIQPPYATIRRGEQIVFKASGWSSYIWSLSDATLGYLSNSRGESTVYTSIATTGTVQVLTCVGVTPNGATSANATTNGAPVTFAVSGTARIVQQ